LIQPSWTVIPEYLTITHTWRVHPAYNCYQKAMQQGHKKMCLRIGLQVQLFSIIDASVQTVRETF